MASAAIRAEGARRSVLARHAVDEIAHRRSLTRPDLHPKSGLFAAVNTPLANGKYADTIFLATEKDDLAWATDQLLDLWHARPAGHKFRVVGVYHEPTGETEEYAERWGLSGALVSASAAAGGTRAWRAEDMLTTITELPHVITTVSTTSLLPPPPSPSFPPPHGSLAPLAHSSPPQRPNPPRKQTTHKGSLGRVLLAGDRAHPSPHHRALVPRGRGTSVPFIRQGGARGAQRADARLHQWDD